MPPNTRLLRIASSDQVEDLSESNSNFTVSLNETLNVQQIKGYSVLSVSFPNVFYNISEKDLTNLLVILVSNAVDGTIIPYHITIPPGFYNIDDLMTALKTAIDPGLTPDTITITLKSAADPRLVFTMSTSPTTTSFTT